jgi:hypothetical protein
MVAFRFCHGTHLVHVGQGLGEILERIQALKMSDSIQRPATTQFFQQSLRPISRDWRDTAEAGDTFVISKAHGTTSWYEQSTLHTDPV